MIRYPGRLHEAVEDWLATRGGSVREATRTIASRYKAGGSSSGLDPTAYVTTRLPATYAVNAGVMAEVALALPDFAPVSLRDVGAGPGTASWAAVAQWQSLQSIEQVETSAEFATLAQALNAESGLGPLETAKLQRSNLRDTFTTSAELTIASYVFAELPEGEASALARHLWQQTEKLLILIEPGTPRGFARILAARRKLLADGAHVAGPCTHDLSCPMAGGNWCHFKVRVQRTRDHMHAKAATVPFEDEPYSWLAVSRAPVAHQRARIIAPVKASKAGLDMEVCADGTLHRHHVASRDKSTYKAFRKASWGGTIAWKAKT